MTLHNFIEGLRLTDAIMSSIALMFLFRRAKLCWITYDTEERWIFAAFAGVVISSGYTSFELFAQDVAVGYRSVLVFFANVLVLYALTRRRRVEIPDGV